MPTIPTVRAHTLRATLRVTILALSIAGVASAALAEPPAPPPPPAPAPAPAPGGGGPAPGTFADPAGNWQNFSPAGAPNQTTPFFQSLGSNGRSCASCHAPNDAWSATPGSLQKRFASTAGADPIFASVDGTNCPTLPVTTVAEHEAASSLLLNQGLIRVALTPPAGAQFTVGDVSNPYGCSSTATVSVYRRILPTTNLSFLSTVMWDGRESVAGNGIHQDLLQQASDAVTTHEQAAAAPSASTLAAIVTLELAQFSAQSSSTAAGSLDAAGATGGPVTLAGQSFVPGSNNPFGGATPGVPPQPTFTDYSAWEALAVTARSSPMLAAEASIGRGEHLFNTRPITITGVAGLNDQVGANGHLQTTVVGTCGTCHNAPNAGSSTLAALLNTGIAQPGPQAAGLPLITLVNKATGARVQTTDPGLALTTGNWADVGKFKVPTLRNLAARGPYFHNGSAPNLNAVVNFYNQRFSLNLSTQEQADLVAFLGAL
jgi:cytochrome c peroxidase